MTTPLSADLIRTPTEDEIARYRRDGYLVVRGLIPAEVLDVAERGMERFYSGDVDRPFPGRTQYDHYDWAPEHGDVLRKNDYTSRMVEELRVLVEFAGIAAFAAHLAGTSGIRLWHDQLLYKPPSDGGDPANVGWHTDRQYWRTCSSEAMLTCWVPFHDCDAAVGGVAFVAGSHLWEDQVGLDFFDPDLDRQEAAMANRRGAVRKEVPNLNRGDVTFHHSKTVHGSGPNLTTSPRRSMAIHLQPRENHWVDVRDATGSPGYHRNDELVRRVAGSPDYADPAICPQLWPTTETTAG